MGIFDAFKKKKKEPSSDFRYFDLRSDFEKSVEANADDPLPEPLESYAQQIFKLFDVHQEFSPREEKLREIGQKMDDNNKQLLVAYRAQYLCRSAARAGGTAAGEFSMRLLEHAWDGLGGWMY